MIEVKKNNVLERILVAEAVSEGKSMSKVNGMVIFVEGAVPGDVADLRILKVKSNYAEAKAIFIHVPSEHRAVPFCQHFGTCGGCIWQHMDYKMQLFFKQKQVEDALTRIGGVQIPIINPILPSEQIQFYRNRLDFTFSKDSWLSRDEMADNRSKDEPALGFHVPKRFDKVLDIKKCYLQDDFSNKLRLAVKDICLQNNLSFFNLRTQEGFMRNLVIRNTSIGQWMVIVVFHRDEEKEREILMGGLSQQFPQITSLLYIINPKRNDTFSDLEVRNYKGADHIIEEMPAYKNEEKKLRFKIRAKSFYQTNSNQAYRLYKVAAEFAGLTGTELVYDLYTGTGTIANFIAAQAKKVIGIDYISDAIEDAKENSRSNAITNTDFFAGDLKDTFTNDFVNVHGKPEVVITDPPRAGMHEDVVNRLNEILPEKIVYVSCNPATQARDIKLMSNYYTVEKLQPVDMFPHTSHVENVALLRRNTNY